MESVAGRDGGLVTAVIYTGEWLLSVPAGNALVDATFGGFVSLLEGEPGAGQRPPPVEEPDDSENAVNRSARGWHAAPAAEHPVVSAHHGPRGP